MPKQNSEPKPGFTGSIVSRRKSYRKQALVFVVLATITAASGAALALADTPDRFVPQSLRGLAARAPYFHNGFAATLLDAVNFYDTRFELHLSQRDKDDLVAFLKTL